MLDEQVHVIRHHLKRADLPPALIGLLLDQLTQADCDLATENRTAVLRHHTMWSPRSYTLPENRRTFLVTATRSLFTRDRSIDRRLYPSSTVRLHGES